MASNNQTPLMIALTPLLFLYAVGVVLILISRADIAGTLKYWEFYVVVAAFISLITGWSTAYAREKSRFLYLIKLIINWGLVFGMLWLLQTNGVISAMGEGNAALGLIYILALVSLLVGLQTDWQLFLFGAFLGISAYLMAPGNVAPVAAPIGKAIGVEDLPNRPVTMTIGIAVAAFILSAFVLIGVRAAGRARSRAKARARSVSASS